VDQNVGVNDILASVDEVLVKFWQSPVAARLMEESYSQVDVAGYNYGDSRYLLDLSSDLSPPGALSSKRRPRA
jgi:hypothetical protein